MTLRVSGKNVDIGDSLRTHVENRIGDAVDKYFDGGFSGQVTVSRDGASYNTDCMVHLDTGIILHSTGSDMDPQRSADQAAERIEKRLRRYKRRLKDHHAQARHAENIEAVSLDASYSVLAAPEEEDELPVDYAPAIVAESSTQLKTMTVAMAVMELDMTGAPVVVFRHAGHGGVNVVYKRNDGNIGWVDPSLVDKAS